MKRKKTLIIQGGGFRTGFSTGVLDAFQKENYNDFDVYLGISGGAIALSYFLSEQREKCFEAMRILAVDKNFISYSGIISAKGIMNIDYFHKVADELVPFDLEKALSNSENKKLGIVLTNRSNGIPNYYHPTKDNWMNVVIASCTLPFVTKGQHEIDGVNYFDGGWGDPLPAKWAHELGARDITIIRTAPKDMKFTQSWPDYLASFYNRNDPKIKDVFESNHQRYNDAINFINNPPKGLIISQIAPESPLRAGTYSNSIAAITADYKYGLKCGKEFLKTLM
jgi:predicted patatin/cPLA2 family phospholipase